MLATGIVTPSVQVVTSFSLLLVFHLPYARHSHPPCVLDAVIEISGLTPSVGKMTGLQRFTSLNLQEDPRTTWLHPARSARALDARVHVHTAAGEFSAVQRAPRGSRQRSSCMLPYMRLCLASRRTVDLHRFCAPEKGKGPTLQC